MHLSFSEKNYPVLITRERNTRGVQLKIQHCTSRSQTIVFDSFCLPAHTHNQNSQNLYTISLKELVMYLQAIINNAFRNSVESPLIIESKSEIESE